MVITQQEEKMIKALREAKLPPLFVLVRIRNEILNDTENVEENRRDVVIKALEKYIGPLWDDFRKGKNPQVKEEA
ncbi:hypothetical protein J31TS4_03580 [Paenibacillus sp. J31TS4]|uniref:hypothetical protein n=1 Tax=Paenibacillus sp. J31TS4 TaxID=2807195 RepID=UPI001B2ECB0D|nr:hypothetical protein [Paenibacillus sp. J31TS4]GIP37078.1 hypothetical protein J31TS4_03580 [Paenibacillus sp. J31TS4]